MTAALPVASPIEPGLGFFAANTQVTETWAIYISVQPVFAATVKGGIIVIINGDRARLLIRFVLFYPCIKRKGLGFFVITIVNGGDDNLNTADARWDCHFNACTV